MGIKVLELEGAQLDYWVARAEGIDLELHPDCVGTWVNRGALLNGKGADAPKCLIIADGNPDEWADIVFTASGLFRPSTEWADCGPIIESERIAVWSCGDSEWCANMPEGQKGVFGYIGDVDYIDTDSSRGKTGPTPLTAAMRAYVASKFGEEVPSA